MSYESLLAEQVPELLEQADVVVLDTRDAHSFAQGHLPNAKPADEANIARLIRGRNKAQLVLVYCYHGTAAATCAACWVVSVTPRSTILMAAGRRGQATAIVRK